MTYNKRILGVIALALTSFSIARAQSDTTEYLFKKAKYSYMQFHFGYQPMFFANGQTGRGTSMQLLGVVFNDKLAIGLDFDIFTKQVPYVIQSYPYHTVMANISLTVEPLIRPKKVLNFSLPMKIGYGGAQTYTMLPGNYVVVENPSFFVATPGAMVWVNLFKPLSIGCGASYRMAFNKDPDTFEKYSGLSVAATLRFKFYTKEYMEKALQRQKEYFNAQPPK